MPITNPIIIVKNIIFANVELEEVPVPVPTAPELPLVVEADVPADEPDVPVPVPLLPLEPLPLVPPDVEPEVPPGHTPQSQAQFEQVSPLLASHILLRLHLATPLQTLSSHQSKIVLEFVSLHSIFK